MQPVISHADLKPLLLQEYTQKCKRLEYIWNYFMQQPLCSTGAQTHAHFRALFNCIENYFYQHHYVLMTGKIISLDDEQIKGMYTNETLGIAFDFPKISYDHYKAHSILVSSNGALGIYTLVPLDDVELGHVGCYEKLVPQYLRRDQSGKDVFGRL